MSEKNVYASTIEQIPHEIEQKFLPIFPERLDMFRLGAIAIEQLYLSHPSEDYSLRIRETTKDGTSTYSATLKDAGKVTSQGIDRLEIETPVNEQTFALHRKLGRPAVRKLRAKPVEGVAIDFFEDGHVHAESEDPQTWRYFLNHHQLEGNFEEITGDRIADNEWRAHFNFRHLHNGRETLTPQQELNTDAMRLDIIRHQIASPTTMVRIAGRSGSGKSTLVRELRHKLETINLPSIVMSTDDYHRGKTWLEAHNEGKLWTEWDAPIVYDRAAPVRDIDLLRQGESIAARRFNFTTEESETTGVTAPAPIIIIEGIYARHHDFDHADLSYEVPTPLATCIGRRVIRDLVERPRFDPGGNIRYMLESAEPAWLAQQ